MTDLYVTDEKGRNVYYVYKTKMPSDNEIRIIKYDFGTNGYDIALVAKDCLDALGYRYNKKEVNKVLYQYVSPENIINGDAKANVYMHIDKQHVEPAILISENGFFELIGKSDVPDAVKFRHWVINRALPLVIDGDYMSINRSDNGGIFEYLDSAHEAAGIPIPVMAQQQTNNIPYKRVVERVQ